MKLLFKEFMKWRHLKWFLLFVVCLCVGCFGISMLQKESGCSAMPTYYDGDITLGIKTNNVTYGNYISIDGVKENEQIHKRVIAMPGDHLTIHDSAIIINGTKLKENYLAPINRHFSGEVDIVLGEDEYFVMGDNRKVSYDSREFGPVHKEQISRKTIARVGFWYIIVYAIVFSFLIVFIVYRFILSYHYSVLKSDTAVNFGSTK